MGFRGLALSPNGVLKLFRGIIPQVSALILDLVTRLNKYLSCLQRGPGNNVRGSKVSLAVSERNNPLNVDFL